MSSVHEEASFPKTHHALSADGSHPLSVERIFNIDLSARKGLLALITIGLISPAPFNLFARMARGALTTTGGKRVYFAFSVKTDLNVTTTSGPSTASDLVIYMINITKTAKTYSKNKVSKS